MWLEWTIATRFLREGKAQSTLILVGIAVGVAVIVFLTALITGLQGNIINRTLGTQAHIKVQPTEESNRILAPAAGTDYWSAVSDVQCPSCGDGVIRWAEAGHVPGYRICDRCRRHYLARGDQAHPVLVLLAGRRGIPRAARQGQAMATADH